MKKLTTEAKLKRALASLDTVVQEWYKENNPECDDNYASVHIRDFNANEHCSKITIICKGPRGYVTLASSKDTMK